MPSVDLFFRAIVLLIAFSVASAGASPRTPNEAADPALPVPPTVPPQSPSLEVRILPASTVAVTYARLRIARDAERPDGTASGDPLSWSPMYATMSDRTAAGTMRRWQFEADESGVVRRAYALSNRPGPGYGLLAEVACNDTKPQCDRFETQVRALPAPPPIHEADFDPESLGLARTRYASWLNVLESETCVDHPPTTPSPAYPPSALREGIEGTVHVQVAFNRCGQVRDASVRKSSRNRDLDRAAVAAVRMWSMGREANAGKSGLGLLPVTFSLDAPSPPAQPAQ